MAEPWYIQEMLWMTSQIDAAVAAGDTAKAAEMRALMSSRPPFNEPKPEPEIAELEQKQEVAEPESAMKSESAPESVTESVTKSTTESTESSPESATKSTITESTTESTTKSTTTAPEAEPKPA